MQHPATACYTSQKHTHTHTKKRKRVIELKGCMYLNETLVSCIEHTQVCVQKHIQFGWCNTQKKYFVLNAKK